MKTSSCASLAAAAIALCFFCCKAREMEAAKPEPPAASKAAAAPKAPRKYLAETIGSVAIAQLYADGFEKLPLKDKILAYHLSKAAIAGRDITYDQKHSRALEVRNLLEEIVTHEKGIDPDLQSRLWDYLKLIWVHTGFYNMHTSRKFMPTFSYDDLVSAAKIALKNGADFGADAKDEAGISRKLGGLKAAIFDPQFEPSITTKNPAPGKDIITASFNNFYEGLNLKEVENFKEKYPLNSKLAKRAAKIEELVYRAGGDGVPAGLYAEQLGRVVENIEKALPLAPEKQRSSLELLIRWFKTGEAKDFYDYNVNWITDGATVETINGFIESYTDARGIKADFEGIVLHVNPEMTRMMADLAANAQHLEDRAPWDEAYKKKSARPPIANAYDVLVATGDGGPVIPIGINLPNEQEIRQKYGSKNFLLANVLESYSAVVGQIAAREFGIEPDAVELEEKYGSDIRNAETALHEVIGHGSGKVSEKLTKDPSFYLKEYYSTMEETRAELVALWNMFDERLIELGIVPDLKAAEYAYSAYARADLVLLRRIAAGDTIEGDHLRATHLIVQYLMNKTKAIDVVQRGRKTFLKVNDFRRMREGVGELLREVMRTKAEGDYQAIKALVDTYAVKINTGWRDEVVERARAAGLPTVIAMINPQLRPATDAAGNITDVKISYPLDFAAQMLRYSGRR